MCFLFSICFDACSLPNGEDKLDGNEMQWQFMLQDSIIGCKWEHWHYWDCLLRISKKLLVLIVESSWRMDELLVAMS